MANTLEGLLETTNEDLPAEDHRALEELTPDDLIGYPYGWVVNLESGLNSNQVMNPPVTRLQCADQHCLRPKNKLA